MIGRQPNHDTKSLLELLKRDCDTFQVTNLGSWFRSWNTDVALGTVISELGICKKIGGRNGVWNWVGEEPTEDMAYEVREVANQYKNYAN